MTRSRIAGLLLCALLALGALSGTASAKCVGPAVFNCTAGNTPQPGDFVLGGSNTAPQSGQVIRWTLTQFFGAIPLATGTTPGTVFPDGTSITVDGTGKLTALAGAGNAPGGSTWSAQVKNGSGGFNGVSQAAAQLLIGQASGSPLAQTITGCTLTAAGLLTCPASNTGTTGHLLPFLDGNNVWGNPNTYGNNNVRILGSGAGYTSIGSANAGAVNFAWMLGAFSGTALGFATGTPPIAGQCPVAADATGRVTFQACGSGSGGLGTISDPFGDLFNNVAALQLGGTTCALVSGTVICNPTTPPRLAVGGTAIAAADMGNAIVFQSNATNNAGGVVLTVPVSGSGLWGNGQGVLVSNESTQPITVTVASGTGAVVIEPANPTVIPATANGIPSWALLTSDGTNVHPMWGGTMPNMAYTNQQQSWNSQLLKSSTPALTSTTFAALNFAQFSEFKIVLTTACSSGCLISNPASIPGIMYGTIEIVYPATGSASVTWDTDFVATGGSGSIQPTAGANAVSFVPFRTNSAGTQIVISTPIGAPTH